MAKCDEQLWAEEGGFLLSSNELYDLDYSLGLIHPQHFCYMNNHIYFNKTS